MAKRFKPKESDLYKPLKAYLEIGNWEVYSEVEDSRGYRRADIVATRDNKLMVIEMKTTLTFKLIEQAIAWKGSADYIYIAVPRAKTERSWLAMDILEQNGIGIMEIDYDTYLEQENLQKLNQLFKLRKKATYGVEATNLRKLVVTNRRTFANLTDEHKTWAVGGSATGETKYVTSYSLLMFDVYSYLRDIREKDINDGWVDSFEIWNHLKENSKPNVVKHYSNPRTSIVQALTSFETNDIESIRMGNRRYFRIMEGSSKYLFEEVKDV